MEQKTAPTFPEAKAALQKARAKRFGSKDVELIEAQLTQASQLKSAIDKLKNQSNQKQ
jgi:hypothetical protein